MTAVIPDDGMPLAAAPRDDFISAMGSAVTGVTVVSTAGESGRFAVTVSAMSSVSADPPLLLVCINRRSPTCAAIRANGAFCVNVLAADQRRVAETFAGRPGDGRPYDFDCARWHALATGVPALEGAVANFDCALSEGYPAGSHMIFIGRVEACRRRDGTPLLYTRRRYGQPTPLCA